MEVETIRAQNKGHFSSEIGANSLEHDFASKTTLLAVAGGGSENMDKYGYKDPLGDDCPSPDRDRCLLVDYRYVIEDGEEVRKPANRYYAYLKDGPSEGTNRRTYHLEILKQVVGSDAIEVYAETIHSLQPFLQMRSMINSVA